MPKTPIQMNALRVVFVGTGGFGIPALRWLASHAQVIRVVTQPDRRVGKGRREWRASPIKEMSLELGLGVYQPEDIRATEAVERILSLKPDIVLVADYGQFLPDDLLDRPPHGALNLHASLLPRYRGASPINRAIWNGDRETGVTIFTVTSKVDAGTTLAQTATLIGERETAPQLHQRLSEMAAELLAETLPRFIAGEIEPQPQDPGGVTRAPKLKKTDGQIDWSQSAEQIDRQVRALQPWPLAYSMIQRQQGKHPERFTLLETLPVGGAAGGTPGAVVAVDKEALQVQTGRGLLRLVRLQPAGKKPMTCAEFLRGHRVLVGDRFGDES